jgi:hypothetical protein
VTQVIDLQGAEGFADGHFDGTALTVDGAIVTAPRFEKTGTVAGPVLRAFSDGSVLLAAPLRWLDSTGAVIVKDAGRAVGDACTSRAGSYFAAMPGGLLRFRRAGRGAFEVVALPRSHRALWALSCTRDGAVLAATGPTYLYRLKGAKVAAEKVVPGSGLRSVLAEADQVIAGDLSDGRVWRWRGDELRVLFVADKPEVRRLVRQRPGVLLALSISAESGSKDGDLPAPSTFSRGAGAVQRFHRFGAPVETLWRAQGETPLDLIVEGGRAWVGTDAGQIYRLSDKPHPGDARLGHWRTSVADERAVEALAWRDGALIAFGGGLIRRGVRAIHRYRSPRLDAGSAARFGALRSDEVGITSARWRFGNDPDGEGWSPWRDQPGGEGLHAQVQITLKPGAVVRRLQLFARRFNRAPIIDSILVLAAGTKIEPGPTDLSWDKGFDLPAEELDAFADVPERWERPERGKEKARLQWRPGYRAVIWKASDPDEDRPVFRVELEALAAGAATEVARWQQTESFRSLHTADLRHGAYRLRIAVRDGESDWSEPRRSRIFAVDHRPPTLHLLRLDRGAKILRLRARDDDRVVGVRCGSGAEQLNLIPADGLADSGDEVFVLPPPSWAQAKHLRRCEAIDPSGNRTGIDLR